MTRQGRDSTAHPSLWVSRAPQGALQAARVSPTPGLGWSSNLTLLYKAAFTEKPYLLSAHLYK